MGQRRWVARLRGHSWRKVENSLSSRSGASSLDPCARDRAVYATGRYGSHETGQPESGRLVQAPQQAVGAASHDLPSAGLTREDRTLWTRGPVGESPVSTPDGKDFRPIAAVL